MASSSSSDSSSITSVSTETRTGTAASCSSVRSFGKRAVPLCGLVLPIGAAHGDHRRLAWSSAGNEFGSPRAARVGTAADRQVTCRPNPRSSFDSVVPAGLRYGFVGAGGGSWYWKPLRNLNPGHRVFAYVGGAGYVGIGEVVGQIGPLRDLVVTLDGSAVRVVDQPDVPRWLTDRARLLDEEISEFAVPVRWLAHRQVSEAVSERGLFASQLSACKLRDERTIEVVTTAFGLNDETTPKPPDAESAVVSMPEHVAGGK